jgi:hypothetical protein
MIGDRVDLDDLPSATVKSMIANVRPRTVITTPAAHSPGRDA